MLVISMPKSASTSLMSTLGRVNGLESKQLYFAANPWPPVQEWPTLPRFHSDMRELSAANAQQLLDPQRVFKQHIIPTSNNVELLSGSQIVLLTRDPRDVVLAYRRNDKLQQVDRGEWKGLDSEAQWLTRAQELGLIDELQRFAAVWASQPGVMPVSFDDVTLRPAATINAIQEHLGLERIDAEIELDRMRWTRGTQEDYRVPMAPATTRSRRTLAAAVLAKLGLEIRRKPRG